MHKPVLLKETLEYLNPQNGDKFIDCTIGLAGHSLAILEKIIPEGKLLGIELDPNALAALKEKISKTGYQENIILAQGNFTDLKKIVQENNFGPANGIVFDLGLSSWQLEQSGRGFSFQKEEPLDMRFDPIHNQLTAQEIINNWPENDLTAIFENYGQEHWARRISRRIVQQRKIEKIINSKQLADLIRRSIPRGKIHPATKVFQALRIAVNNELENLKRGLEQAEQSLKPQGRLVVISFHSLEDRIVKNFLISRSKENQFKILTKKPIGPSQEEIKLNPRSRSAKLRAALKL